MAEQRLHKTTVAGPTPAPATVINNLETAYNKVSEDYRRKKLQPPVRIREILALALKAVLATDLEVNFIRQVLEEAEKPSKP